MASQPDQPTAIDSFTWVAPLLTHRGPAVEHATRHELLPLLYPLVNAHPELAPGADLDQLRAGYIHYARHGLRLVRTLVQVLNQLEAAGIPALVLKGPAWAVQCCGDLTLRYFDDLDILIHPADFPAVYKLLCASGWVPAIPLEPRQFRWLIAADKDLSFTRHGTILEVHWDVAERGMAHPIPPAAWWEEAQTIELLGRVVQTLSAENTFLLLCLHGARHQWQLLKYLTDLAGFLAHSPGLDLQEATRRARRFGFGRIAGLGLYLVEQLAAQPVPAAICQSLRNDPAMVKLAQEVTANLKSEMEVNIDESQAVAFFLRARERWRDRAYYLFDQAFKPKQVDWQTISLPRWLYFAYFVLRPARLVNKFVFRRF